MSDLIGIEGILLDDRCNDDALHRYSYTLKKFPKDPTELAVNADNVKAILEMKFNILLNLSRCYRKLQNKTYIKMIMCELHFALIYLKINRKIYKRLNRSLLKWNDSYEAFYSRARAKRDLRMFESALEDLMIADKLCYGENPDIKKTHWKNKG
ncbi:TANC2 isoform X5 [Brachionus plicatilis]|uniref:TANC2 isoform X5 n=1 Tax=Brachionus plicatilis TaxID=10195 RepID=A0A3M7PAW6_BRAPC|nr:TANC2 isoform X5 [Brachionus plicatilis]